jgi:c-di-GMP phosphodiesterase
VIFPSFTDPMSEPRTVPDAEDIFVARQPIFDLQDRVAGYELLYRRAADSDSARGLDHDRMSAEVLVNASLGIGLDQLLGEAPAFMNFTREALLQERWRLIDPARVIIELLEMIEPDDRVFAACQRIRGAGYRLALDDFEYDERWRRFFPLVEVIKVDVLGKTPEQIRETAEQLLPVGVRLLAERVETTEVRALCADAGYTLFQGYFFARPETVQKRELPLEHLAILRLMNLLQDPDSSDVELEEAFRNDISLTYRLLRIVNSAAIGGRGIESIRHALRIVGRDMLYRWMALLLVNSVVRNTGRERELAHMAVQRARICARIAEVRGAAADEGPLFMVGLFSLLDAILNVPMEDLTRHLNLSADVCAALLRTGGPYAASLAVVEAYERGEWEVVGRISRSAGVSASQLSSLYVEAMEWARERTTASRA